MPTGMVIIASRDGDLEMTIDASRDGDRSIPGWLLWMAITASRDGDRCIPGWRSMHPWIAIDTPLDGVAVSLNGDR